MVAFTLIHMSTPMWKTSDVDQALSLRTFLKTFAFNGARVSCRRAWSGRPTGARGVPFGLEQGWIVPFSNGWPAHRLDAPGSDALETRPVLTGW